MKRSHMLITAVLVALVVGPLATTACAADAVHGESAATTSDQATEEYAYSVGKQAYLWGWVPVNLHSRREWLRKFPGHRIVSPINRLVMLLDYIPPEERFIVTPNQDVAYGQGFADLSQGAVVIQIPDFGDRFWVLQCMDAYSDVFADPGWRTKSKPGFYLLVGPNWKGQVPPGIVEVLRSPTNLAWYVPRVFLVDSPKDKAAAQPLLNRVGAYPLTEFNGKMKTYHYALRPGLPSGHKGQGEHPWVVDARFWEDLAAVLAENKPRQGEEPLVASFQALLAAWKKDPLVKRGMARAVQDGRQLVETAKLYGNVGTPLGYGWSSALNGGAFGTDYLTRTLVGKAYLGVNKPQDALYIGTDLDGDGKRLNGAGNTYTLTFSKGQLPPAKAFWSLTLYDTEHFFYINPQKVYSRGTKNKDLQFNPDGSLTIYIQNQSPGADKETNWLPCPAEPFSVLIRIYVPDESVLQGPYSPPPVERMESG